LPSGWRIEFGNNVNFIFETDDVRHASPATISRMGIVNMRWVVINNLNIVVSFYFFVFPNSYDYYPANEIPKHELSKEPYGDLLQNYVDGNFQYAVDWVESQHLLR